MIDLHSHILPGLDDGAADLGDTLEIARAAVADGIEVIAGTPHVRDDYPTTPLAMEVALAAARGALADAGVPLEVRSGGEIAIEQLELLEPDDLRRFGLGGSPRYLLVEFPYSGWPLDVPERLFRLQVAGITAVLAHPERNAEVQANPAALEPLVAAGALVQLTASSVDGRGGSTARRAAKTLLDRELAHLLASDAHTAAVRGVGLSGAVEAVADPALARWLTVDVPAAILAGDSPPPRPLRPSKRRWSLRGRR